MKTSFAVAAAVAIAIGSASAFSLDFASLASGTPVPGQPLSITISVPGYGDVAFSSAPGSALEIATLVGSGGPTQSINMNGGEALVVVFQGTPVSNVNFGYEQAGPGESFSSAIIGANAFQVNFSGQNAGVSAVTFVPEPTAALLGALGSLLLLRRRRD